MAETNEKAATGRINSIYTLKTVNDQGIATIEGNVIVRDQSEAGASAALIGVVEGLLAPAKAQLK